MSISLSTNLVFKPLISAPSIFTCKHSNPNRSIVSNPIKPCLLRLYAPHSLREITFSSLLASCVAQASELVTQAEEEQSHSYGNGEEIIETGIPSSDVAAEDGSLEDPKNIVPPDVTRLFVGNLPYDLDAPTLAGLFQQAGNVDSVDVMFNNETQEGRGFGFVTMSTIEESHKAVKMFNRYELNGRLLTVNKASPKGTKPEKFPNISHPEFRIHVGNLPWNVDKPQLEELFQEHGEVLYARIVYERETNQSRGFGFVTMSSEAELDRAIAAVDGKTLNGRVLKVSKAQERPAR